MASDNNPADLNNDGKVTTKERRTYKRTAASATAKAKNAKAPNGKNAAPATGLAPDRLNRAQLRSLYGFTARQLKIDDELFDLFQKAWKGQWDEARFDSEVEQLDWYRKNKASLREYQLLAAEGGADFLAKTQDAQEFVRNTAMMLGRRLSVEQIASLAEDSMMQGWGEPGQDYELKRAIMDEPEAEGEDFGGTIEEYQQALRTVALANGVKLDEAWINTKAKSAASGLSLIQDAETEVREMAAQKVPGFAQQILAGQNLDALVSPWRRMMAEEWEMADTQIMLDDPTLLAAYGSFDEKGNPQMEDLGSFQMRLRKDPRWLVTAQGQNKTIDAYSGILKMFGYGN